MAILYFYDNSSNADWNDSNNWGTDDAPASGGYGVPSPGDELYIRQSCSGNVPTQLDFLLTISNGAQLTTSSTATYFESSYSLTVESGGILYCSDSFSFSGTLTVQNGGQVYVAFNIFDTENASTTGVFELNAGGSIYINASTGIFRGLGTLAGSVILSNSGYCYVYSNSLNGPLSLSTNSTLYVDNGVFNVSSLTISNSTISLQSGANIAVSPTIPSGSNIVFTGTVTLSNSQTITNNGTATIATLSILQGAGSSSAFINNSTMSVGGEMKIQNITNTGTYTGIAGSTLTPTNFTNNGTVNLHADSYLNMSGNSSLINNNVFSHGSYTTRFKGRVFPQVPSSASWGNVFL